MDYCSAVWGNVTSITDKLDKLQERVQCGPKILKSTSTEQTYTTTHHAKLPKQKYTLHSVQIFLTTNAKLYQ